MSQPPSSTQRQSSPSDAQQYARTLHNVALFTIVACPVLALLPPRKFDVYTVGLIGTTAFSVDYLTREQTGRSIWQHVNRSQQQVMGGSQLSSSEHANVSGELRHAPREVQRVLPADAAPVTAELGKTQNQREAWKVQREKEIQDDLDVGKGFGDMIMDQIWEVVNWGKKEEDENQER